MERKKKLKESFDAEYDVGEGEGGSSYLDELKKEVNEQEKVNRLTFEGMDDHERMIYEGARPGAYVRMEIRGLLYCGPVETRYNYCLSSQGSRVSLCSTLTPVTH